MATEGRLSEPERPRHPGVRVLAVSASNLFQSIKSKFGDGSGRRMAVRLRIVAQLRSIERASNASQGHGMMALVSENISKTGANLVFPVATEKPC